MNTCANPDEILKYIKTNKLTKEKFCEKFNIELNILNNILNGEKVETKVFYELAQSIKVDICFLYNENCTKALFIC